MWPLPFRSPLSPLPSQYFHIHCSSPKVFFSSSRHVHISLSFPLVPSVKRRGKSPNFIHFLNGILSSFSWIFSVSSFAFLSWITQLFSTPTLPSTALQKSDIYYSFYSLYVVNFVTLPLVIKPLPPLISADPQTPTFHKGLTFINKRQGIWYLIFNRFNRNIIKKSRLLKLESFPLIL